MGAMQRGLLLALEILVCALILLSFLPLATALTANLRAEVEGDGFHRTLKYHVDTGSFKNQTCHIAVFVRLPVLLYTNVDELADLRRVQKSSACSEGEIDVELFAEKAYYQNVTVCSRLTSTKLTLSIPIHQRYRFATETEEPFLVSIPRPQLLIGCKDRLKEHRISKIKICWPCIEYVKKWRDLPYNWEGDGNFTWEIPAGNTSRKFMVTSVTMFVTLLGGAYVLWAIHKSFDMPKEKKPKDN